MDSTKENKDWRKDAGIPRRACLDLFTPAEKAVWDATQAVESVGAHPLLTDAAVLLQQAREKVADFVDLHPGAGEGAKEIP